MRIYTSQHRTFDVTRLLFAQPITKAKSFAEGELHLKLKVICDVFLFTIAYKYLKKFKIGQIFTHFLFPSLVPSRHCFLPSILKLLVQLTNM